MRHYFKARTDGTIEGVATTHGGFNDAIDLTDDLNQHPHAESHRRFAVADPTFDRFYRWDCSCPDEDKSCHCPHLRFVDYYVHNNALVEKVPLTLTIDGVDQPTARMSEPLDYPPGTAVTLTLKANVPDGTTVTATPTGRAAIARSVTELTFTNGETNPLVLRAPAQGTAGRVFGSGKLIRPFVTILRGWA
ncbi:MAG: hypothetical protein AB7L09_00370 [Nitrospira sp.]